MPAAAAPQLAPRRQSRLLRQCSRQQHKRAAHPGAAAAAAAAAAASAAAAAVPLPAVRWHCRKPAAPAAGRRAAGLSRACLGQRFHERQSRRCCRRRRLSAQLPSGPPCSGTTVVMPLRTAGEGLHGCGRIHTGRADQGSDAGSRQGRNSLQQLRTEQQAGQPAAAGVQQRRCMRRRYRAGRTLGRQEAPQLQPQRLVGSGHISWQATSWKVSFTFTFHSFFLTIRSAYGLHARRSAGCHNSANVQTRAPVAPHLRLVQLAGCFSLLSAEQQALQARAFCGIHQIAGGSCSGAAPSRSGSLHNLLRAAVSDSYVGDALPVRLLCLKSNNLGFANG